MPEIIRITASRTLVKVYYDNGLTVRGQPRAIITLGRMIFQRHLIDSPKERSALVYLRDGLKYSLGQIDGVQKAAAIQLSPRSAGVLFLKLFVHQAERVVFAMLFASCLETQLHCENF